MLYFTNLFHKINMIEDISLVLDTRDISFIHDSPHEMG